MQQLLEHLKSEIFDQTIINASPDAFQSLTSLYLLQLKLDDNAYDRSYVLERLKQTLEACVLEEKLSKAEYTSLLNTC